MPAHPHSAFGAGKWMPTDPAALEAWLKDFSGKVRGKTSPRAPVIEKFAQLIDTDPVVRLYLTRMIDEVPRTGQFRVRHLQSVDQMLGLLDAVLTYAPEFDETAYVGCPIDAILDWSMGTSAGFAAIRHPPVNEILRQILNAWAAYLQSAASLSVINATAKGWKCKAAREQVGIEDFQYDPRDPHWGFSSWNDYFTRRLREGARPLAEPKDDAVIVSPCEAVPYRIAREVRLRDEFWVKRQPYSLADMLPGDSSAEDFVGGTVWQAFLSAHNFHRWNSPVSGRILKAEVVQGTYFSECVAKGEDPDGPTNSQPYLAHVATRAIIPIQADHSGIGHLVVMPIGMGEISSCVINRAIKAGAKVKKGAELGYFQYGGSTVCCLFRPGAIGAFAANGLAQPEHEPNPPPLRVNAMLAHAV